MLVRASSGAAKTEERSGAQTEGQVGAKTATQAGEWLATYLRQAGLVVPAIAEGFGQPADEDADCSALTWAGSGAMWLTGWPDGPPQWPTGDVIGALSGIAALLAPLAGSIGGTPGPLDIGAMLTERAAARAGTRQGGLSVGGRSRIVRAADGWLAVTLARADDVGLFPALVALAGGEEGGAEEEWGAGMRRAGLPRGGLPREVGEIWGRLERVTFTRRAGDVMEAAQLLGLAAAEVVSRPEEGPPWSIHRLGETAGTARPRPRVVDFSSLWAGPLCAHLLGCCGAEVVKVEDAGRPDAARWGDPGLFEQLHAGHERVQLDFRSGDGRRRLAELVEGADVVIEASRPRALGQLGLHPDGFLASRPGRTWVSITARGRTGERSNWVGFGDDAAAGGGLVAASDPRGPVFCGDAIADPVTGLSAAVGALASVANGGGHLVDCSMVAASAFVNRFGACPGQHRVERCSGETADQPVHCGSDAESEAGSQARNDDWWVFHGGRSRRVERPRPTVERASSMPPGMEVGPWGTG